MECAGGTVGAYLDTQGTEEGSALVTGFRLESRFRPIRRDHIFNPVLYVEHKTSPPRIGPR